MTYPAGLDVYKRRLSIVRRAENADTATSKSAGNTRPQACRHAGSQCRQEYSLKRGEAPLAPTLPLSHLCTLNSVSSRGSVHRGTALYVQPDLGQGSDGMKRSGDMGRPRWERTGRRVFKG